MNRRRGHLMLWLLFGLTTFALALVAVAGSGTTNHAALLKAQRQLERSLEAYRLLEWASRWPSETLRELPREPGDALDPAWQRRLDGERAAPEESAALEGTRIALALEPDASGVTGLDRLVVTLTALEPDSRGRAEGPFEVRATRLLKVGP